MLSLLLPLVMIRKGLKRPFAPRALRTGTEFSFFGNERLEGDAAIVIVVVVALVSVAGIAIPAVVMVIVTIAIAIVFVMRMSSLAVMMNSPSRLPMMMSVMTMMIMPVMLNTSIIR